MFAHEWIHNHSCLLCLLYHDSKRNARERADQTKGMPAITDIVVDGDGERSWAAVGVPVAPSSRTCVDEVDDTTAHFPVCSPENPAGCERFVEDRVNQHDYSRSVSVVRNPMVGLQ
jgi:hypothetical protein